MKYVYAAGILGVALVVFFWVSTANTIDEAKEFALAKPASDLVDREPDTTGRGGLDPITPATRTHSSTSCLVRLD